MAAEANGAMAEATTAKVKAMRYKAVLPMSMLADAQHMACHAAATAWHGLGAINHDFLATAALTNTSVHSRMGMAVSI